jgi:hypothetical protein
MYCLCSGQYLFKISRFAKGGFKIMDNIFSIFDTHGKPEQGIGYAQFIPFFP